MSNFALDTNSSQGDIVSSLNYALANLGNNNINATGNVLTANVQTGAITTGGNTVAYLYQYMNVAYGNSATGSGFTSNSYNTTYYGIHNTTANVVDTNPADYQWTQVAGGFGTTKHLYYQTLGGRQISFNVNTTAPTYFVPVQDNTPINLDVVTGTTGANGAPGINGTSTYYYPVYTNSSVAPYTPTGGSWNFGTKIGIPPTDPNNVVTWSNIQPSTSGNNVVWVSSALAASNTANANVTSLSWSLPAQLSGNTGISTYSFTVYTTSTTQPYTPTTNTGSWNFSTNSGTPPSAAYSQNGHYNITFNTGSSSNHTIRTDVVGSSTYYTIFANTFQPSGSISFNITSDSGYLTADVFAVGGGGAGGSLYVSDPFVGSYVAYGGQGGASAYSANLLLNDSNTYSVSTGSYYTNYNDTNGYGANTYFVQNPSTVLLTALGGASGYEQHIGHFQGTTGPGYTSPFSDVTWAGYNSGGVYYFGGQGGSIYASGQSSGFPVVEYDNGYDGGGNSWSTADVKTANLQVNAGYPFSAGTGGGAVNSTAEYAGQYGAYGGQGVFIMRVNSGQTWSLTPPTPGPNETLWASTAVATTSNAQSAVTQLTWSTPTQVNGQRGIFTSAYVVTPSDPTFYTAAQFTANFSAPRTSTTPPIGTGYSPITGDTATFTYRPTNTVVTKTFYANINQWLSANTQVISGNLFVSNSITASALITTDVYPLNITSQNATLGNIQSPGFWMQASTGNARFGGNISIGNNLAVGNNALFGNNMVIGNSLLVGNNAIIGSSLTVGNNAVIGNNGTIGSNLAIGNNLVVGNNALVGNNMVIGNNLLVGNNASIASNLIVGNNAVIGGNLTILGLVSGGNLRANVVNNNNIAYNAIQAAQMAPLSVAAAAIQSASLLSRLFAPNQIPATALTAGASSQIYYAQSFTPESQSDPTILTFYDFGPTIVIPCNVGDVVTAIAEVPLFLSFPAALVAVDGYQTVVQITATNPDSSVNDTIAYAAPQIFWNSDAGVSELLCLPQVVGVGYSFTATQTGNMTLSLQYAWDTLAYGAGSKQTPNEILTEGGASMTAWQVPYTG